MKLYAYQKSKMSDDATNVAICKEIGINSNHVSTWKQKEGFEDWLETEIAKYRTPIHERLRQVALDKIEDYRFWEAMGKKHAFITDKNEPVEQNFEPLVSALTKEQAKALLLKILTPEQEKQPESPQPKEPTNEGSSS